MRCSSYRITVFILVISSALSSSSPEEFLTNIANEEDYQFYADELDHLQQNPFLLSTITSSQLDRLFWLTEDEKQIISAARNITKSISDLPLSNETKRGLVQFIRIKQPLQLNWDLRERITLSRLEEEKKSAIDHYQRLTIDLNKLSAGFVSQKDPQEIDILDHYGGYLQLSNVSIFSKLIAGYFRVKLGTGLLISSSNFGVSNLFEFGRNSFASSSIKPFCGSSEYGYLRGTGADLKYKHFSLIIFYSNVNRDVSVDDTGITSFDDSGLHLEGDDPVLVKEEIYGCSIIYEKPDFDLGINSIYQDYNRPFSDSTTPCNVMGFSLNLSLNRDPIIMKGDISYTQDKINWICGCNVINEHFKHIIIARNYQKNNPLRYSSSLSAGSNPSNEQGFAYGIQFKIARTTITLMTDLFRFPETRYWEKMPTTGLVNSLEIKRRFSVNTLSLYAKRKCREKYISLDDTKIRESDDFLIKVNLLQNIKPFKITNSWRYQQQYFPEEKVQKTGNLFQVRCSYRINDITIYTGITSSYGKLLMYYYENNLSGTFANSTISGDAITSFILLRIKILKQVSCEFRIRNNWKQEKLTDLGFQIIWSN